MDGAGVTTTPSSATRRLPPGKAGSTTSSIGSQSNILTIKNNRVQAENSVQLLGNRIALLKAEDERSQRRIRAMNMTVEKVQSCQKQEMELREKLQMAKIELRRGAELTTSRIKGESTKARQRLKAKLLKDLHAKQKMVKEKRERITQLMTAREHDEYQSETVEVIRKEKDELRKKKQRIEDEMRLKLERKREQRIQRETERREQAEKRLMEMAAVEQQMLDHLIATRSKQKVAFAQYEKLFSDRSKALSARTSNAE